MPADAKLVLLIAALHLLALVLVAMLLVMFFRSDTTSTWSPPDEGDGGGGGNDRLRPRRPSTPPDGGLPLPDAVPARVRLREPARIGDLIPRAERRPGRAPEPRRAPARR